MRKILLPILALAGLGYFFYSSLMGAVNNCEKLEAATLEAITAASAGCSSDQDCTLLPLTCPYDCLTPMMRSAKPQVVAALDEYMASCMAMCPDCPKERSAKAVCINSRCAVTR